jgi:hypothetical protein
MHQMSVWTQRRREIEQADLEEGNCDIDFYNFCHRKVQNFEIQFERHQNVALIFRRYQK